MVSISVRPERYSHQLLCESGQFAINLPTEKMCIRDRHAILALGAVHFTHLQRCVQTHNVRCV